MQSKKLLYINDEAEVMVALQGGKKRLYKNVSRSTRERISLLTYRRGFEGHLMYQGTQMWVVVNREKEYLT